MAKRKSGEEPKILYRAVKFEVRPNEIELEILLAVSEGLRRVFNEALAERQQSFNSFIAPIYERLKLALNGTQASIREELKTAYKEHAITLYDQINALTSRRAEDPAFAAVTRNFQEETLDALNGAYSSFLALRRNGDYDARPPRLRDPGFFQKIPGRRDPLSNSPFAILNNCITISFGKRFGKLSFPIPEYQQVKLANAKRIKKFELYRSPSNLKQPGKFFISVVYEIDRPEAVRFEPEEAIFITLGASVIGISTPTEERTIVLWRSDHYWIPKIEAVEARMKGKVKDSLSWQGLNGAKRTMQILMARQQLQDQRELAAYLLRFGRHFVVSDLVVRSKIGKLADSHKSWRGGKLGLNWSAQNTGSIGRFVLQLEEKAVEKGGLVHKHKLVLDEAPPLIVSGGKVHSDKIWMVRKLRQSFFQSLKVGVVE